MEIKQKPTVMEYKHHLNPAVGVNPMFMIRKLYTSQIFRFWAPPRNSKYSITLADWQIVVSDSIHGRLLRAYFYMSFCWTILTFRSWQFFVVSAVLYLVGCLAASQLDASRNHPSKWPIDVPRIKGSKSSFIENHHSKTKHTENTGKTGLKNKALV